MLDVLVNWKEKFFNVYFEMFQPLISGVGRNDEKIVSEELQYYLNCSTCQVLIRLIRKSPNDELFMDAILNASQNVCEEVLEAQTCSALAAKYRQELIEAIFSLILTEDYICGYIVPLCDTKYENLSETEYVKNILKDKPFETQDDNALDLIYKQIRIETDDGRQLDSYRVL